MSKTKEELDGQILQALAKFSDAGLLTLKLQRQVTFDECWPICLECRKKYPIERIFIVQDGDRITLQQLVSFLSEDLSSNYLIRGLSTDFDFGRSKFTFLCDECCLSVLGVEVLEGTTPLHFKTPKELMM